MTQNPLDATNDEATELSGRGMQALERLAKLAAGLFDCTTSVILFNQAGASRIVCGYGLQAHYLSYKWDYATAPYGPGEQHVAPDATAREDLQQSSIFLGGKPVGFFLRTPVKVAEKHTITLIILDTAPKPAPTQGELRLLSEIVALIAEEIGSFEPLLADKSAHVSVAVSMAELIARVEALGLPATLLDRDTRIVAINQAAAQFLRRPAAELIGRTQAEVAPRFIDVFRNFYARAFKDKLSTPAIEISSEDAQGKEQRTHSIVATPLSPIGTDEYFLLVTAEDITKRVEREEQIDAAIQDTKGSLPVPAEPSARFLFDTLVERRTIRSRNEISYLTLRSWRTPLRKYQISALKALKGRVPASFADEIASEVADGVTGLVGTSAFKAIVPIPCGHSQSGDCLSLAIARCLAARLNLPMVQALESARRKGSSHPKKNASRPPMALAHAVKGPVLLVDDVATSGAHLEEAVGLLKPESGSVLSVAWIGGNATGE